MGPSLLEAGCTWVGLSPQQGLHSYGRSKNLWAEPFVLLFPPRPQAGCSSSCADSAI